MNLKNKNNLLYAIYLIIIFILLCIIVFKIVIKNNTNDNKDNLENKENIIDKNDKRYNNYVFLGDSITERYPVTELFNNKPIIKSGISGYETKDILDNLNDLVYIYNPTKVFILIGTNDLKYKDSDYNIVYENIIKIIENIKEKRKLTNIYLESILPVNNSFEAAGFRNNITISKLNNKLNKYCNKNNITYINIYDMLLDKDNNLDVMYTDDGLHLNGLGYGKISMEIDKYME